MPDFTMIFFVNELLSKARAPSARFSFNINSCNKYEKINNKLKKKTVRSIFGVHKNPTNCFATRKHTKTTTLLNRA